MTKHNVCDGKWQAQLKQQRQLNNAEQELWKMLQENAATTTIIVAT